MAIGVADVAVAQESAPAQKTRYVYLWDVTGSINKSLYTQMFDFLKKDVERHNVEGTEVYIVPFNDKVVEVSGNPVIFKFKVENGRLVTKQGGKSFGELQDYGWEKIGDHLEEFNDKQTREGYTDIADAVYFAQDNYLDNNYNTIFILLTDGGQEYYSKDEYISNGNADSKARLQKAITELDRSMKGYSSINMLFYVNFKKDDKNPKDGLSGKVENTEFIDADKSTPVIYFCPITASIAVEKISCRDNFFYVNFSKPEGFAWPDDFSITFTGGGKIKQTSKLQSGSIRVECNGGFKVPQNETISVPVSLSSNPKRDKKSSTFYVYWLETRVLDLKVTNDFTPSITVRLK